MCVVAHFHFVPLKVREVIKLIEKHGWRHVRTRGDHRIFENSDGKTTVVAGKLGEDIPRGTYHAILLQTGVEDPTK